jgi:hypothetical protein
MKRITKLLISLVTPLLLSSIVFANPIAVPICVEEPTLKNRLAWNVSPNGLLNVSFDLNGDGKPDYHTLRVILNHYESHKNLYKIRNENSENRVFSVNYSSVNYYYFTAKKPLFYAFDVDGDGNWDLIYKDILEDGVNGNEVIHESPSKMF